ncbi:MAG: uroporphyrinogen-III synthase [Alphaproteobacteria bacterium]|nr:uroporphyrinogen-III synthase [Alphaproteobacteria bacterium]
MTDISILITRPKGDELELTDMLHELNFRVIHEPLTEIMLRHDARSAVMRSMAYEPDAFILTSRHGAQALALLTELRDMFVLCVGEATADTAESLGFTRVSAADGNVAALADYIKDAYDEGSRFTYISGDHVRADLAKLLPTMEIERIIGYEALAAEALSDTLAEQIRRGHINGVTFMSARAASIFMILITKLNLRDQLTKMHAICLSDIVAEPLHTVNWRAIHIASEPTLASLAACVDNAFNNSYSSFV